MSSSGIVPTRSLLTSLSPIASYTLGNALGLGESGGQEHSSTLIHPPKCGLFKARSSGQAGKMVEKWYTLYIAGLSVCVREIEAQREDHDGSLIFATGFNTAPSALACDLGPSRVENTRCLVAFANGAVLLFNPFADLLVKPISPVTTRRTDEDSPSSAAAVNSPTSQPTDRTFHTASNNTAAQVMCITWVPRARVSNASSSPSPYDSPSASSYSDQFLVGLEDGRLLTFDTRIEKEQRLDHPSPMLSKADLKLKKKLSEKQVAGAPPIIWLKEFISIVKAPVEKATATSPISPFSSSAAGSTPPLPASNPVSSWKIHTPPSSSNQGSCSSVSPSILAVDFNISGAYLGVCLSSGHVLVLDWLNETLVACFRTHYSSPTCLKWTSDEKYLLTGGEDDLLCIWDPFHSKQCVAVGEGHDNFLSGIALRPVSFDAEKKDFVYRAISIGQDRLLMFWEFSPDALCDGSQDSSHPATGSKRPSTNEVLLIDRPTSPVAAVPPSSTGAGVKEQQDISTLFIPFQRSTIPTLYPMAKNIVSERALSSIDTGFDFTKKQAELVWLKEKLQTIPALTVTASAPITATPSNLILNLESVLSPTPSSSSPSSPLSVPLILPLEDDLILVACHGHHLKLWTSVASGEANGSPQASAALSGNTSSPGLARTDTLTSRVMRLNTPVVSSMNIKGRRG